MLGKGQVGSVGAGGQGWHFGGKRFSCIQCLDENEVPLLLRVGLWAPRLDPLGFKFRQLSPAVVPSLPQLLCDSSPGTHEQTSVRRARLPPVQFGEAVSLRELFAGAWVAEAAASLKGPPQHE